MHLISFLLANNNILRVYFIFEIEDDFVGFDFIFCAESGKMHLHGPFVYTI